MKRSSLATLVLCVAAAHVPAQAQTQTQDAGFGISVAAKAWFTEWSTFGFNAGKLTQEEAEDKVVFIPVLSVRYKDFVGSMAAIPSTTFSLSDGTTNKRREFDVNVGYLVAPSVAVTVGYKKVSQKAFNFDFRPSGPVVGFSASAPVAGAFSLYGNFGLGRLKAPSFLAGAPDDDVNYRLTEVGLGYGISMERVAKVLVATLGYRTQTLTTKNQAGSQSGRDVTQGLTLGLLASF